MDDKAHMKSVKAVNAFRERWDGFDAFRNSGAGFYFPATVTVECNGHIFEDNTTLNVNRTAGPTENNIVIHATDILAIDRIYLEFSPNYQHYSIDKKTGALVIVSDPKQDPKSRMGRDFRITILPSV